MSATLDEYFLTAMDVNTAVEQIQADLLDLLQ
jgi:hypothetical protein